MHQEEVTTHPLQSKQRWLPTGLYSLAFGYNKSFYVKPQETDTKRTLCPKILIFQFKYFVGSKRGPSNFYIETNCFLNLFISRVKCTKILLSKSYTKFLLTTLNCTFLKPIFAKLPLKSGEVLMRFYCACPCSINVTWEGSVCLSESCGLSACLNASAIHLSQVLPFPSSPQSLEIIYDQILL